MTTTTGIVLKQITNPLAVRTLVFFSPKATVVLLFNGLTKLSSPRRYNWTSLFGLALFPSGEVLVSDSSHHSLQLTIYLHVFRNYRNIITKGLRLCKIKLLPRLKTNLFQNPSHLVFGVYLRTQLGGYNAHNAG